MKAITLEPVCCGDCEEFVPNPRSPESGIGVCIPDVWEQSKAIDGIPPTPHPPYARAKRYCKRFIKNATVEQET